MTPIPNPPTSPAEHEPDAQRLACGIAVDQLLTQVADNRPATDPAHQDHCPSCQTALADLRRLWAPVAELAAEDVRAPSTLLAAVLARIRDVTSDPLVVIVPTPSGPLRVAARVINAVARLAAGEVPAVGLALSHAADPTHHSARDGEGGPPVDIKVDITAAYGAPLHLVAEAVRRRIAADLHHHLGLTTGTIDVTVLDVHPAPSKPARGS